MQTYISVKKRLTYSCREILVEDLGLSKSYVLILLMNVLIKKELIKNICETKNNMKFHSVGYEYGLKHLKK